MLYRDDVVLTEDSGRIPVTTRELTSAECWQLADWLDEHDFPIYHSYCGVRYESPRRVITGVTYASPTQHHFLVENDATSALFKLLWC